MQALLPEGFPFPQFYEWADPTLYFTHSLYVVMHIHFTIFICLLHDIVFSACVAAVKSRPVLHHCVVIFFWSSGIMECTCILYTFENGVPLMR